MTTPTIYPAEFDPNVGDVFRRAPAMRNGSPQLVETVVTLPAATGTSTVVGLIPFTKGARVSLYDSFIDSDDVDTGTDVTYTVGWVYDDNTTYTNDPDGFIASSTVGQSGGIDQFDAVAGVQFIAEADGWIALTTGGGATTTEGDIRFQGKISYDATAAIA